MIIYIHTHLRFTDMLLTKTGKEKENCLPNFLGLASVWDIFVSVCNPNLEKLIVLKINL